MLHFAALVLAPPVEANRLNRTWPLLIVLPLSGGARFPPCAIAAALTWALCSVLPVRFAAVHSEAVAGFCVVSVLASKD